MKQSIALLSCCAPCSCAIIKDLHDSGTNFTVLFFNSNIYPESEYRHRLSEQITFCKNLGIECVSLNYDHESWLRSVQGLESEPEQGKRCTECFKHRFKLGVNWARLNGFKAIASAFGVSRHKSQSQVDKAFYSVSPNYGPNDKQLTYVRLPSNENLMLNLSKDMYRQTYCGCPFSKK